MSEWFGRIEVMLPEGVQLTVGVPDGLLSLTKGSRRQDMGLTEHDLAVTDESLRKLFVGPALVALLGGG